MLKWQEDLVGLLSNAFPNTLVSVEVEIEVDRNNFDEKIYKFIVYVGSLDKLSNNLYNSWKPIKTYQETIDYIDFIISNYGKKPEESPTDEKA
ncbi:MAG: hypothetical protein M0R51_14205 [Clostridia bacterium]|jgi:hypothetical protein|nr:hypothetical protein [Clostridia bacterium]